MRSWRSLIGWWAGLSFWLRFGVAGSILAVSGIALFFGCFWDWGWAVGIVLLLASFPSKAERRGYHDF